MFHVTAVSAGESGLAATLRDEAGTLAARGSYPIANFVLFASVAWDRLLRGELAEAADTAEAWARIAGRSIALPLQELVAIRAGRTSNDTGAAIEIPMHPPDFSSIGSIAVAADAADSLASFDLARRVSDSLRPVVDRGVVFSVAPPLLLPRALATALRISGRHAQARDYLELAERVARDSHAAVEIGLVEFERAKLLAATGASSKEVAKAVGAVAHEFHRLDLVGAAEALRAFADAQGISGATPGALPAPDELSATELDVLREFARGADSAGIGERILIHARTVEGHLSRLARRLGIRTPSDAQKFLAGRDAQAAGPLPPALDELTTREREVLGLVARGLTNQQIADELVISLHTAIRHVANILSKTGAANRTEAARLVVRP